MICDLEAIEEIKEQCFTGVNEEEDRERSLGLISVTDGTVPSIGQLFAASICQGGPGSSFLAPRVYNYLVGGVETILLYYRNQKISPASNIYTFYSQVRDKKLLEIIRPHRDFFISNTAFRLIICYRWFKRIKIAVKEKKNESRTFNPSYFFCFFNMEKKKSNNNCIPRFIFCRRFCDEEIIMNAWKCTCTICRLFRTSRSQIFFKMDNL